MRHGFFLPPFDELADPRALADIARLDRGPRLGRPVPVGPRDATRAADRSPIRGSRWPPIATVTERIRLGPMITPIVRRRPQKLAREAVTLDVLSRGRLVLGLGLGVDTGRELSAFGEVVDPVERGQILDEGARPAVPPVVGRGGRPRRARTSSADP